MARPLGYGLVLLLSAACTPQQQPALYASAAEQPAYAERYPGTVDALRTRYAADEQQTTTATAAFAKYPDELNKPSWPVVIDVMREADRAGGTADLASAMNETETVRTFYAAEKEPIRRKVAGAVDYAAKQKHCEGEGDAATPGLGGAAAGTLDRALDQAIEDRIHDKNPAVRMIEDNQDAIGKQNVDKLTKQVDQLTLASYTVRVRMPQTKRDIDALLDEASKVKSTLEADQQRANAVLADKSASSTAKAVAEKRRNAASNALAGLDSEVSEAKKLSADMDQRTKAAQKSYDDALAALEKTLDERAKAAPQK